MRSLTCARCLAAALVVRAAAAGAQDAPERPRLGSTLTAPVLADLPTGGSLYSVLDTMAAEVISDRADTGGLYTGEAARIGSHGSSWTQTVFRVGDADITAPTLGGVPMLVPITFAWERVDINTGLMPIDVNAPGLVVTLVPRRPAAAWTREVSFAGTGPSLLARQGVTTPPALATQHTWDDGQVLLSGPLAPNRVGIVLAGEYTSSSRFERSSPALLDSRLASIFAHLVFTPGAADEVRAVGWAQHASVPAANGALFLQPAASDHDAAVHGQLAWDHKSRSGSTWTAFGSVASRRFDTDLQPVASLVVDRVADGPVPDLVAPRVGSETLWSAGIRAASPRFAAGGFGHVLRAGLTYSGASVASQSTFSGRIGELVAGIPARIWAYTSPAIESHWGDTVVAAYGDDVLALHPRLTLEAGIRFEALRASADGSAGAISWQNWLPRGNLRWQLTEFANIAAVAGFARYGDRLPLADLAVGDPAAPFAAVFRWDTSAARPSLSDAGPLVARMGPGTDGDARFTTIDPSIVRPYMDEFVTGFESRPRAGTVVRLAAIARREKQMLGVVDVGVPESAYNVSFITDPGGDHAGRQQLPVYDRPAAMFGLDRYVLTNGPDNEATFVGVELTMQAAFERAFVMAGATAGRSEALSANVGFRANENDPGLLGEVFIDPNARTFAQGRVFSERGYTIKTAGVFTLPWKMKLGYAARYQDGQHFARLVVVPGLGQGAEAIRAFRNGRTRFTYTATLDGRLQKALTVGGRQVALLLDAYNILNMATEIEEFDVTGPLSRVTSATQPPRTVHVGVRLSF